jgi:hypothetical protein
MDLKEIRDKNDETKKNLISAIIKTFLLMVVLGSIPLVFGFLFNK